MEGSQLGYYGPIHQESFGEHFDGFLFRDILDAALLVVFLQELYDLLERLQRDDVGLIFLFGQSLELIHGCLASRQPHRKVCPCDDWVFGWQGVADGLGSDGIDQFHQVPRVF